MAKNILIIGFGPGISTAVAERFGAEGFAVGVVARNKDRLAEGVAALKKKNIAAIGVPGDAADPESLRAAIRDARGALGPLTVLHWNAIGGGEAGDLLEADAAAARRIFDVAIYGLLAAVQEALPDLKKAGNGAVLVTNGAFGEVNPQIDAMAVGLKVMGLGVANGAKHKLVGLLSERLKADGVYVGEVMVAGIVKGTPWDNGSASIEASAIAAKFLELFSTRSVIRARVA